MAAKDDEEERLRSVALQNAQNILAARRRAEEALSRQSEWLRVTLASIGDAVITTDAEGRVTFMNRVAESLTGWAQAEALGRPLPDVFHIINEQSRAAVVDPATKALRDGIIVGLANHTLLIARDGTERAIDDSASPIRSQKGEIVGCVLVFRDITERRRVERDLQQNEARKTAMFETALDCIISIDHDGTIIEFNAAAERTFGHRREDALGRELAALIVPPAFREPHRKGLLHYLATGEGPVLNQRLELSALRADGAEFPVELTVTRIPVGGPPTFTAYLRDITEAKRAVEALRESEGRFRVLFDLGPVAVFSCDRDGVVQNYNRRAAELWGREPKCGDISERYCGSLKLYLPDGRLLPHSESPIIQVLRTGVPVKDAEVFIERPDGSRVAVIVTFSPLQNERGEITGAITAFYDITDRKRLEDELRQHAADLSEVDRRKNEFLATLAHELRNPLAPIRNGLQLMRLAGSDAATVEHTRTMMERQMAQLVRLVDDLLDLSRINSGKIELRKERIQLAAAVTSAIETSRPLIEQMGHELTVSLPEQPIVIDADLTRLSQVFLNLLNNAAKYSERVGRIRLTAERQGSDVVVSVKDTGIGLAADQLPRIFEMFLQVDNSLDKAQGGLGIGLTLVRRLVAMHGGKVEARSEGLGKGSEFIVRLPIVLGATVPEAVIPIDGPIPQSSLRILVVDDNYDGADSLAEMLTILGNETRTAYDGEEAVAAAREFLPDVILLDIGLPKLNGYEACRRIREHQNGKRAVIIAQTGWGQDDDRRRTHEAGFDHHMVKPVDPSALMKLLAELQAVER